MPATVDSSLKLKSTPAQEARKESLKRIIRKGLPPFPQTAVALTKVLGGNSPDLHRAGKLISADPTLTSQVLRICNSPMFGLRSRVVSIEQATVLLGADRLRNLALTSTVVEFAKKALPATPMNAFWKHSFLAGKLSQYLARRRNYFLKEQAYIAGLLHDIGQVPLWMLVNQDIAKQEGPPEGWPDNSRLEREYFGTDHCELGGSMAEFWDFLPPFVDVLKKHHTPELAKHDAVLVRMVAVVECFLKAQEHETRRSFENAAPLAEDTSVEENAEKLKQLGGGLFHEDEWPIVREELAGQYERMLPLVEGGLEGVLARIDEF